MDYCCKLCGRKGFDLQLIKGYCSKECAELDQSIINFTKAKQKREKQMEKEQCKY